MRNMVELCYIYTCIYIYIYISIQLFDCAMVVLLNTITETSKYSHMLAWFDVLTLGSEEKEH